MRQTCLVISILILTLANSSNAASHDKLGEICMKPLMGGFGTNLDVARCRALIGAWIYNTTSLQCEPYDYGGCEKSDNIFYSKKWCDHLCSKENIHKSCLFGLDIGRQPSVQIYDDIIMPNKRWYYDSQSRVCKEFLYLGAHGNLNNFPTNTKCKEMCANNIYIKSQRKRNGMRPRYVA